MTMSAAGRANPARLGHFIADVERALAAAGANEAALLAAVGAAMRALVSHDDWLDDAFARPNAQHYQQYLLHLDPAQRFSIVSFVWGPGQATPVHDHKVWGVIGVLRGAEVAEPFEAGADGRIEPRGEPEVLGEGAVAFVSPGIGDVHRVRNAYDDRVSISIHVYGANIGAVRRFVYGPAGRKQFVSGYANAPAGQAN
jgi:predicted metal-dependent enzyme (double-stranded beta helix superfamily)